MHIAYRWWGWVIVRRRCIVIGCVDVAMVLHFTLKNCISYWRLRAALTMGALEVITCHMRVLKNGTHG